MDIAASEVELGGPHAALLEELRQRIFQGPKAEALVGDPRASLMYEKIAELLELDDVLLPLSTHDSDADDGGIISFPPMTCPASAERHRLWAEYVATTMASIKRRETLLDIQGRPRVTRVYAASLAAAALAHGGTGGAPPVPLHHVNLADWRGRRRVRVVYDGCAEAIEIQQCDTQGVQTVYTASDFEPTLANVTMDSGGAVPVSELLQRARQCAAQLRRADAGVAVAIGGCSRGAAAADEERAAIDSIEALCDKVFPRLNNLLQRERDDGRQIVPCSEDLLEMELERIVEMLETPIGS